MIVHSSPQFPLFLLRLKLGGLFLGVNLYLYMGPKVRGASEQNRKQVLEGVCGKRDRERESQ